MLQKLQKKTTLANAITETIADFEEKIHLTFEKELIQQDEEYHKSMKWKKDGYACYGKRERIVYFKSGKISLSRYYYYNRKMKNGKFWLDETFDIRRYKRIADDIYKYVYENFGEIPVNVIAKKLGFSRQSIYNILNELGQKKIQEEVEISNVRTLYLQADEDHIKTQKQATRSRSIQGRIITLYEDRQEISKGRYKLINKRQFIYSSKVPPKEIWEEIEKYISLKYPKLEKLYFGADGGNWIKKGIMILEDVATDVIYIYDKFHLKQNVMRMFQGFNSQMHAYGLIKDGKALEFVEYYYNHVKKYDRTANFVETAFKTVIHNWQAVQNNFIYSDYYGTSAESQVSHYLSKYFSSRPKAFAQKSLKNYLNLVEYRLNGITYHQYQNAPVIAENERFIANLDECHTFSRSSYNNNSSVIAVLNHAANTELRKTFSNIVGY